MASGDVSPLPIPFEHRSPDDEPATALLIDLRARAGDRLGALATYDKLRSRLEAEFGAEPSPATQAIVERLRGC